MLNRVLSIYGSEPEKKVFLIGSLIFLLFVALATLTETLALLVFPFAIFLGVLTLVNYRFLYFLFLFIIPFTIEIQLGGSLGMDLPAEPLMLLFTAIFGIRFLMDIKTFDLKYLKHPISIMILLHLVWIFLSSITAENQVISFKYFLAKLWYVVPFYFFSIYIFRDKKDFKRFFWVVFSAIFIAILFVNAKHALLGFTFVDVNKAVKPFFRNHVNYAALIVIFLPFVVLWLNRIKGITLKKLILWTGIILFLLSIYLTYTRAAMLSVFIAFGAYFIIKFKLVKMALLVTAFTVVAGLSFVLVNNEFMEYAPDFEKTVTHTKFNNLVEATAKGQDVSTMERVYRWLAGYYMIQERPIMGFGAGNYYTSYKAYTVNKFRTYVSNNPDKSGIHCYYLMILVEQGFLGFFILLGLCTMLLIRGERLYHRLKDKFYKDIVMASTISLVVIMAILLINDMLEAVKVGSFFFLFASFIMIIELKRKEKAIK
jgi:O-antigen ligase